jgi:hypothetical protein
MRTAALVERDRRGDVDVSDGNSMRPGMRDALRASKLPKRKPTDDDRPPPSTFGGKKPKLLPGQTDLFGGEILGVKDPKP